MLSETEFHRLADAILAQFHAALEEADAAGALEAELEGGALTVTLPSGKQYLISKHGASRQLWVSSPLSGGLHFRWSEGSWALPDGRTLAQTAGAELSQLSGAHITL